MEKIDNAAFREKRKQDRLSANELAERFGVSKGTIYKWETGTQPMTEGLHKKLQEYINGVKPSLNGSVPHEDYKEKYYTLLEKYTALLEKK